MHNNLNKVKALDMITWYIYDKSTVNSQLLGIVDLPSNLHKDNARQYLVYQGYPKYIKIDSD